MADVFSDVLVIDMSQNAAGPQCASAFTDFGAKCIHIEPMKGGGERTYLPLIDGQAGGWLWFSRGKKSITLDPKHPEAREIIYKLIEKADVFIESAIPGTMDRNGLGYEKLSEINPRLVYVSVTGFGSKGPLALKPSYDTMGQALSGRMSVTGEKGGVPMKDGNTIADFTAALAAYAAAVTALFHARLTGEGQHVETSLIQANLYLNSTIDRLNDGTLIKPNGNHHTGLCPFGVFSNGKGESVVICCPQPRAWEALAKAMKRDDYLNDPKYDTINKRAAIQEEIIPEIEAWLGTFDTMDDAVAVMEEYGVPNCPVLNNEQVLNHPQIIANNYMVQAPTPDGFPSKTYTARGPMATLSKTPGSIHKTDNLGQSNYEILGELGYSREQVDKLLEEMNNLRK